MGTEAWPYEQALLDFPADLDLLIGYQFYKLDIIENNGNDSGREPDDTIKRVLENYYYNVCVNNC